MAEFPPNGQIANEARRASQNKWHEPFPRQDLGQTANAQYPPPEFILPDKKVMPRGAVTILSGQGGLGKSGIMLQLGAARSLGSQWLGEQVSPGRTLYFNCEDTARVENERGSRIVAHYACEPGDLSEFEVVDRASDGDEWVTFDHSGKMKVTAEFQCAKAMIMLSRPELVVVDGASQTYGDLARVLWTVQKDPVDCLSKSSGLIRPTLLWRLFAVVEHFDVLE